MGPAWPWENKRLTINYPVPVAQVRGYWAKGVACMGYPLKGVMRIKKAKDQIPQKVKISHLACTISCKRNFLPLLSPFIGRSVLTTNLLENL